jgi:hypothetical protein
MWKTVMQLVHAGMKLDEGKFDLKGKHLIMGTMGGLYAQTHLFGWLLRRELVIVQPFCSHAYFIYFFRS